MDIPNVPQTIVNFGANERFTPAEFFTPKDEREVLELLDRFRGRKFRTIGRLHSWSAAAVGTDIVLDLQNLNRVSIEHRDGQVWATVGGGCQIKQILTELERQADCTLPTLGLISEQTIAGAISTGTHGSGRHSLSHYMAEVRVAVYDPATGEPVIHTITGGDQLRAARCSLGTMGIILSVTFCCRPQYRIEEHVRSYQSLSEVLAAEETYPLQQFFLIPWCWKWLAQHRRETDAPRSWLAGVYRIDWFLVIDIGLHLVVQLLVKWLRSRRLIKFFLRHIATRTVIPNWKVVDKSHRHLVMEHELFRHIEIELFVTRDRLAAALAFAQEIICFCDVDSAALSAVFQERLRELGLLDELHRLAGHYTHHYPICIRRVLPDDTLISMSCGGNEPYYAISLISYAWPSERASFFQFATFLSKSMAKIFAARPHWGKVFPLSGTEVANLYPNLSRFREICREHDPQGTFRSAWINKTLFNE